MKKTLILFSLITKQYLKNPIFLFLALLLPLSAFALSRSEIANHSMQVDIGICSVSPDTLTGDIFAVLEKNDGIAHFVPYETEEQMTLDILRGEIDCGYFFKSDLEEKLDKGKPNGTITLFCTDNSDIAAALGNEIIFCTLLQCHNPQFLRNFISGNALLSPYSELLAGNIFDTLKLYEGNGSTYHVEFGVLGEENTISDTVRMPSSSLLFPVRGTLHILVFAAGLFGGLQFLHERRTGLFQIMPKYCQTASRFLYPLSIGILVGLMATLTLVFSGVEHFSLTLLATMAAYVLFTTLYCGLLTWLLPSEMIFAGAIPIFLMISFVACPVFINLKPFVPGIDFLRHLLPPGYFL